MLLIVGKASLHIISSIIVALISQPCLYSWALVIVSPEILLFFLVASNVSKIGFVCFLPNINKHYMKRTGGKYGILSRSIDGALIMYRTLKHT